MKDLINNYHSRISCRDLGLKYELFVKGQTEMSFTLTQASPLLLTY